MPEVTYESLRPLIKEERLDGVYVKCVFLCPETGTEVSSSEYAARAEGAVQETKKRVKRGLFGGLRRSLQRTVSRSLGYGIAGRAAGEVVRGATDAAGRRVEVSRKDIRAATVRAFEKVKDRFHWDEAGNRWVATAGEAGEEASGATFEEQLEAHPIGEKYDRGVLGRMLVEIACADGTVGDDEREFLGGFIDPELGSIDDISARPGLSGVELEETGAGSVRDTLLMLAWAVALSDEDLAEAEQRRLSELAGGLGIAETRSEELRGLSVDFLVEQAIAVAYPEGERDEVARAEAMLFAAKLGVDSTRVERAEVRYKKKMGIF